jgi:hypothetical protein
LVSLLCLARRAVILFTLTIHFEFAIATTFRSWTKIIMLALAKRMLRVIIKSKWYSTFFINSLLDVVHPVILWRMNKLYLFFFCILLVAQTSFAQTPITGTAFVCVGATTTLSNATPGGFWISGATTIATVDSFTGVVTGVSAGTADIGYQTSTWIVSKTVTVNPRPALSSSLTPASVCDSTIFSYTPLSSTPGTTFAWGRAAVAGIIAPASTGAGNPNEQLINTTYMPIGVVYVHLISRGLY